MDILIINRDIEFVIGYHNATWHIIIIFECRNHSREREFIYSCFLKYLRDIKYLEY